MHALTLLSLLVALVAVPAGAASQAAGEPLEIDGQEVTHIVHTPAGSDLLAVIADTTIYTYDSGEWQARGSDVPDGQVVWDGRDPGVLLAGDHAPCMRGGPSQDLYRSDDDGQTWTGVPGVAGLRPLAIWPEPNLALAASCAGLQVSRDGGLSWSPVPGIESGWELTSFAEAGTEPVVLVGLTGEGGTSYLRSVDFTDPAAPVVSADLRTYYAIAGLAAREGEWVLAGMDGVWVSADAGATWERRVDGLEGVVLEQDPATHGLPVDFDPQTTGLFAVAFLPGERGGVVVGSADGLYLSTPALDRFTKIDGTSGRVDAIAVDASGTLIVYQVGDAVYSVTLPE